jgi:hypothetical protein
MIRIMNDELLNDELVTRCGMAPLRAKRRNWMIDAGCWILDAAMPDAGMVVN